MDILNAYKVELNAFFTSCSDNLLVSLQTYSGKDVDFNMNELVPLGWVGTQRQALLDAVAALEMKNATRDSRTPLQQIATQVKVIYAIIYI
jgi:hypothetical protein